MRAYAARRLLALIPTIFFAESSSCLSRCGSFPVMLSTSMLSQNDIAASGKDRAQLEAALGLDTPIYIQYFRWVGGVLHGDLGRSLWQNTSVRDQIFDRLPITFELGFPSQF